MPELSVTRLGLGSGKKGVSSLLHIILFKLVRVRVFDLFKLSQDNESLYYNFGK